MRRGRRCSGLCTLWTGEWSSWSRRTFTNNSSFSAAQIGLPKLMKEEDIHCEYPVDADDEYVTEKGFLPTLPGESTKISSALALFRATRILAKVLTELYPASPSHELSLRTLMSLSDELDTLHENLPAHLRLQFVQDKPSTNVVNSRSPILVRRSCHYSHSSANMSPDSGLPLHSLLNSQTCCLCQFNIGRTSIGVCCCSR